MPPALPRTGTGHIAHLPVTKRLLPGRAGTLQHSLRFGDPLVCVRYRHDPESGRRYTTVELVVSEGPMPLDRRSGPTVLVRVKPNDTALQQLLAHHGAVYIPQQQACRVSRTTAIALGLQSRVIRKQRSCKPPTSTR